MSLLPSRLALLFLSAVLVLSTGGCDALGPDDEPPSWVGDWRITEIGGTEVRSATYFSYTPEALTTVVENLEGCSINRYEITRIEGRKVTLDLNSELETHRLDVSGDSIIVTVIRSNTPSSEGVTFRGGSAGGPPRELADC